MENTFDLVPLSPIVRPIVAQVAEAYCKHLQPWLTCLLIHGSAYKGGFIEGCSDIDLQLYLEEAAFERENDLPLDIILAIQNDLAQIDIAPFQYIQTYAFSTNIMRNLRIVHGRRWISRIPGTYHKLYGDVWVVPEATEEQVIESARATIHGSAGAIAEVKRNLLSGGQERFARHLRHFCTVIWPTLYSVLTLRMQHPFEVWQLPKEAVIALLPENEKMGQAIRGFYHNVSRYYAEGQQSQEVAFQLIRDGVLFLQEVEKLAL